MTMLAIDWGYALLVTGMGIGTVFLLLIVLIWVIGLQTKIINGITGHSKGASEEATVRTTETHPTPHEQAAIAMAMHLYFDAHDHDSGSRKALFAMEFQNLQHEKYDYQVNKLTI